MQVLKYDFINYVMLEKPFENYDFWDTLLNRTANIFKTISMMQPTTNA